MVICAKKREKKISAYRAGIPYLGAIWAMRVVAVMEMRGMVFHGASIAKKLLAELQTMNKRPSKNNEMGDRDTFIVKLLPSEIGWIQNSSARE